MSDCTFPWLRDAVGPPFAELQEVGAELPRIREVGSRWVFVELVCLTDVWDGTADEPERDAMRAIEADGLNGCCGESSDNGEVGSKHHVAAAFEHFQLVAKRARGTVKVGAGDDIEDGVRRRGNRAADRPERANAASQVEVERERAACKERVAAGG